jgi:hypothetical protein
MRRLAISGVVCLSPLVAAVALADAPLRINEFRLEQPGADTDEYIEIAGAPAQSLAGLSLVVIGDDDFALPGEQNGTIEMVVSLDGFSVPSSGFFVVGEPKLSLATPDLATSLNLEGGDNVTILLVRNFSGFDGQKLDIDDNGTLDITPWTEIVSGVAALANANPDGVKTDYFYAAATVGPEAGQQPAAAWLCGNDITQWNVGSLDPFTGVDSPGAANDACLAAAIVINEIRIDMPGLDNNEYVEIAGPAGSSLEGLTYFVIGDGAGASGVIERIITFPAGATIGGTGFYLIGGTQFSLGGVPDLVVPLGVDIFENSDNVTHLLVRGFTGTANQDLDTNDDGVLDATPWTELLDSVALIESDAVPPFQTEYAYGDARVGPDGPFVPGHIYRCSPNGDWQIGPFDPTVGLDTPRAVNSDCTTCGQGAGNCHEVHKGPGCLDSDCCELVCTADPTCCELTWDQDCVNSARNLCLEGGAPPALQLNEIRIDEASNTDPNEYIEIVGAPGTFLDGVSIVIVGDGADTDGSVEAVISLDGAVIPKDGVFLVAESTFTLGTPDLSATLNLENGDSVTYFLVWNFTGLNFTDYDGNNDCTLDSQPWDATIDSLGVVGDDNRCVYSTTTVGPDYVSAPAHLVRCLDGSWRFGRFDIAAKDGFDTPGTPNTECPAPYACGNPKGPACFTPHAGVGCADEACCRTICAVDLTCCEIAWDATCAELATLNCFVPGKPPEVSLSEIRIDQQGFDVDEYFELAGEPDTLLNGLTYIVIGDGPAALASGVVEFAQSLNGFRIPESGFFLAARSTLTLGGAVPDLVLPNSPEFENSDNVTHMLVFGFTGAIGDDLDTNDDGELDVQPWDTMLQTVAFIESATVPPTNTEYAYGNVRVGPDSGAFVPSQLAYCPTTDEWTIGTFIPDAATVDSPGAANYGCDYSGGGPKCPADIDGDGAVGATDLGALLGAWGGTGAADIDGDGTVGATDLGALLGAWGACP